MTPTGLADVQAAAARIAGLVHRTPLLRSHRLDELVGTPVLLKAEHLQRGGAFKARGATNAVRSLADDVAAGVAAHSSGNHAAALAIAAADRGIPAHVVMPADAPAVKRAACAAYGARITLCEPTLAAREATLAEVLAATGATEVHPYDDPCIVAGAGTAALEVLEDAPEVGAVVVPVGGGGLASGTVLAVRGLRGAEVAVHGAEPAGADDAARSLAGGALVPSIDPDTICDGLRTSLAGRTFDILSGRSLPTGTAGLDGITTVADDAVVEAMAWIWTRTKQVVEPSAAIGVAAARRLVAEGTIAGGTAVAVVLTGGNVDPGRLPFGRLGQAP